MSVHTRVRKSWWPLGPTAVVAPSVAIVAVVLVMTWPMLGWPYPLWVQTSAQFHQQFTWAGLIAGTAACWYATQLHPADRIWVQPRAPRLGVPIVTRHLTVLVTWYVGAYLLALIPLVVATLTHGGIGAPDPLAMLSGVLAMAAAVLLGYALGTVVPAMVMVPITAAAFYALLVVGHAGGDNYAVVAPVLHLEPELGQRESPALVVFRIAVFVAVSVAAASLATRCLRRLATGGSQAWRRLADAAMYVSVPVVLIVVSLVQRPALFAVDEQPAAVCETQRGIRYCVNVEHQPRLAALIDTVDPILARYGATPDDLVTQIWDQSLAFGPIDVDIARTLQIAWLDPDGVIETDIPGALAGIYSCTLGPGTDATSPELSAHTGAGADEQARELENLPGDILRFLTEPTEPPSGAFAGMSVPEVQRWLARHQQQVHTCTLTSEELPQP
ncbi:hypothetical protein [Actinophytocola sediminis]